MDAQPAEGAPPVVAVLVARDPGPWMEEALAALERQDYPNLSILVLDATGTSDLAVRVAQVAPGAYVRRMERQGSFGNAANDVLTVVEGASHFLFCHDDVAPEPDAVRLLVEEAFRSNAGVVAPKLVEWDRPDHLLAVGMGVDKLGMPSALVEPGELDQEQHDAVRDVFFAPEACSLVRADLFSTLGGFDPVHAPWGQDIDFCWRAHVAGARVVVAPAARVRHRAVEPDWRRPPAGDALGQRALSDRHRLRMVLTGYGRLHLLRVLPQMMVLAVAEAVWAVANGQPAKARAALGAWSWNLRRLGDARRARRLIQSRRVLGDREIRFLQAPGHTRLSAFLRRQMGTDGTDDTEGTGRSVAAVGRDLAGSLRQGTLRLPVLVWGGSVLVLLFGSRHLLGGTVPSTGQLAPFPHGPGPFLRQFLSGWRPVGLGSGGAAPAAFGFLGVGGIVLLGGMGLLRKILVLGALPLGAAGAFRLAKPLAGRRGRLAAVAVYLAVPVPYDALARGRWSGLLAYAAAPFVLRRLMTATRQAPFASNGDGPLRVAELLPLGVLLAVLAAFVPSSLLVVPLVAAGLVLGSLLVGGAGRTAMALAAAAGAVAVAIVLLVPWSLHLLGPGATWSSVTSVAPASATSLDDLLRFHTGPIGGGPLGWAFVVVAALPLVIGREWRFSWAVRLWSVALVCWGVAWAGGRGWLGFPPPPPEVLLAPAAAALALCAALGVVSFEADLPGYVFGWRQVALVVAAAAGGLGALPVLAAAGGGQWGMPAQDDAHLLSWMAAERSAGDFRVLWAGDPRGLPVDGWRAGPGLAYATSRNGPPDATFLWPGSDRPATRLLADALNAARTGRTTRLGHLLAPMAVRYLVLPRSLAAGSSGGTSLPLPADLTAALQDQLDLKAVEGDPSLLLYENVAWAPARSVLPGEALAASRQGRPTTAGDVELAGSRPVLGHANGTTSFSGPVEAGDHLLFAEAASGRWELAVQGHAATRRTAFGWANAYDVGGAGPATLRYRTSPTRYLAVALELALWGLAVRALVVGRRRRPPAPTSPPAPPSEARAPDTGWDDELDLAAVSGGRTRRG